MTAVDFPSTLYKVHIPLLIRTIPTNKRHTPNICFPPYSQSDIRNPLSLLAHNRITAPQFIRRGLYPS